MKLCLSMLLAVGCSLIAVPQTEAGGVTVKNAHVCCGACVAAVKKALTGVEGVSNAAADQKTKTITFDATDDAAAKKGVQALAKAGFHGAASHGDKLVAFPKPKAKKGDTANSITFTNVHLCCGACEKGAKASLQDVKNVTEIAVDSKTKTVTVTGENIDLMEAITAFNAGGFHAGIKGKKAE